MSCPRRETHLRIVAGRHRGRALTAPEGTDTRPTADRARQAVFDVLAHGPQTAGALLAGARVLDAFAGSGAMGLEALSRGAVHVTFLDSDARAVAVIRGNVAALGEDARCAVIHADLRHPPAAEHPSTLAFLDPPYGHGLVVPALQALAARGWFAEGAVIVAEHDAEEELAPPLGFRPFDARRYGRARFLFLRFSGIA